MRVSEYFKLGKTQPYLDFVDVRLNTDIQVFVDPTALRSLKSTWGHACASLVQHYFEAVLAHIKKGNDIKAQSLLNSLSERNEFHLGYCSGRSKGHAFGKISAKYVWGALSNSLASKTGLLQDLEDTCLLIKGIDKDMISDAVCNIIRGPLIKYTQDMCAYYGILLTPDIPSGPIWNPTSEAWESSLVSLPMTDEGKVILIPKILVRHNINYQYQEYYRHFLLPIMQDAELQANTSLVRLLKDGRKRVTKIDLLEKYGSDKLAVVNQTLKYPHALKKYKTEKEDQASYPLNHEQFSQIEENDPPNWDDLIVALSELSIGQECADEYEKLIEKILSALFYPSLCNPTKQHKIHEGRKRIDITYTNESKFGFFAWLSIHYPSAFIFVECKNYGKEIGNPEIDQLSGRFSPSRGIVGILVCRSVNNPKLLEKRCIDTAKDQRGYILVLSDTDIINLIKAEKKIFEAQTFPLLMNKFRKLVD